MINEHSYKLARILHNKQMHYTRMRNFDWTMLSQDFTVEHCYTQQHMRGNPFQVCSFLVCICMRSISEAEQCPSRSFHYYSGVYKYFSAWTCQRIQSLKTLVHDDGINFTSAVNSYFASTFPSRNEQWKFQCTRKLITRPLQCSCWPLSCETNGILWT